MFLNRQNCYQKGNFYFFVLSVSMVKNNNLNQRVKFYYDIPIPIIFSQRFSSMGSSFNKDPHAQLFITLEQHINYAGQMVSGAVHINCTADRLCYQQLRLRIDGKEEVCWTERRGNHNRTYSNKRETYRADVELTRIPSGLMRGHYTFPFSFLLPAAMPASFQIDKWNFIKYRLYAVLPNCQDFSK